MVQQAVEQQRRERSVAAHKLALCRAISCIHRKHSYWKQIFSDSWFEPKPFSAVPACTQSQKLREETLKLAPLILQGVGHFLSYIFSFTTTYFLSLNTFFPLFILNCCLPSSCRAQVSVQNAVWFFKCQHTGACPGGGVASASAYGEGACRAEVRWNSQGPNVNTACDTPSQRAFKTSEEVNIWAPQCKRPVICWVYKTVRRNPVDPGLNPNSLSVLDVDTYTCQDYA